MWPSPTVDYLAEAPINLFALWGGPPKTEKNWASLRKWHGGGTVKVTHQKTGFSMSPQVGPAYNSGQSHDDKRAP